MLQPSDLKSLASALRASRLPEGPIRIDCRLFEEIAVGKVRKVTISVDGQIGVHKYSHFHARVNNQESGSFRICDCHVYGSTLTKKDEKVVTKWATDHREKLQEAWDAISGGGRPVWISTEF